jgi:hypothetical protein
MVFLDFEASSLSEQSYPIEIGWVFADGRSESHLIRPAPRWDDWDAAAEAVHGISRAELLAGGEPHDAVARRMVEALAGHDLYASAPSWDGKWMSALLRAAGLPRHALRVSGTDALLRETARAILAPVLSAETLRQEVESLLTLADVRQRETAPAHRALADAQDERLRWLNLREAAQAAALAHGAKRQ